MAVLSLLERKLTQLQKLDDVDISVLRSLPTRIRTYPARTTIVRLGDRPDHSILVLHGHMIRQKTISTGTQIQSLHLQSDLPDLQSLYLKVMDHDLTTVSESELAFIPHTHLRGAIRDRPNIATALWRETLIDTALLRNWVVNVGRRIAIERLAFFFLELGERMRGLGQSADKYHLPFSQSLLGSALGITDVHTNRSLQQLTELVSFKNSTVTIKDRNALTDLAGFDADHLRHRW